MYARNLEEIVIDTGSITTSFDLVPKPYNKGYGVYHKVSNVVNVDVGFLSFFVSSSHEELFIETMKFQTNLLYNCN